MKPLVLLAVMMLAAGSLRAADPLLFGIARVHDVSSAATEEMTYQFEGERRSYFVDKVPTITERDIVEARFQEDEVGPGVLITLNDRGRQAFADLTREAVPERRMLAIIYDGRLVSVPSVRQEIAGGQLVISGGMTREQAMRMKSALNQNRTKAQGD